MVKTPRTHHSRTVREPVTIDLQPGEVSRVKAEAEAAEAKTDAGTATPEPDASSAKAEPASEAPKTPDAKPAEKTNPQQASGPAFGRAEKPAEPSAKPAASEPSRRGGGLLAGVAGGVIVLAAAAGLSVAGLLPGTTTPQQQDHAASIAALEAEVGAMRDQMAALGTGGPDEALAGRVAQAEQQVSGLSSELESLRGEVAALGSGGSAPAVDLGPLEDRIAALESALAEANAGGAAVSSEATAAALEEQLAPLRQDIAALREEIGAARESQGAALARLDAMEEALAGLSGRVEEQEAAPATAAIIAVSALKAAIDRGAPFTTELDTFASLMPAAPQIGGLRALAAEGIATRAQIAAEADAAANAMIAAARPVDPEAGVLDWLWGSAVGMVQVRPVGMVEGEGVPEIAARIDAAVGANDYARAIAEFEALPEAAKAAGAPFMAKVQARHEADRLIDEALASALRA